MPARIEDALHLASALALAEDLDGAITYDARPRDAAEGLGLRVVAPLTGEGWGAVPLVPAARRDASTAVTGPFRPGARSGR